jgi:undecaprenol kinase
MYSKEDVQKEKKAWREVKIHQKFLNAFRGLKIFWLTTRNLLIHLVVSILVIILGFYFHVSSMEWIVLVFSIGFVLVTEAINTAIEIDIDLTSPEYHPFARDTKDVAAGAVLLSVFTTILVGLIIFLPKVFVLL